jgi:23S rRNA (cytosine1962-C5)-methyltransferase
VPDLYLRKGADRRLRAGHLWVYSNEVDSDRTPLGEFEAGDVVTLRRVDGMSLGTAYMDPQALICARKFAADGDAALDPAFFAAAVGRCLAQRDAVFDAPCYRLAYGDSDGLPGLVIDRFHDYLVLQFHNAGIERWEAPLLQALVSELAPAGILLRGDARSRRGSGEAARIEVVHGEVPDEVPLEENGVRFLAPVRRGQKTGWFYDHRLSRARLAAYAPGARVLDVYSYIGGWGIQAGACGAAEISCLDSSATALAGALTNAELNGLGQRLTLREGAAAESMAAMADEGLQYDLIILDPPAFVQRRRELKKGVAAYRRINELALRLLAPGGVLVSCSCSMHLARSDLIFALQGAALRAGCELRILEQGGQGPDHPVHPAIPETEYLKAVFARRI